MHVQTGPQYTCGSMLHLQVSTNSLPCNTLRQANSAYLPSDCTILSKDPSCQPFKMPLLPPAVHTPRKVVIHVHVFALSSTATDV